MKDRIGKILEKYQLSSAQFADIIGVQRSSISHILSGRNKPSFDFIQKILLKYAEIDANWLLTGQGELNKSIKHTETIEQIAKESDLFTQNVKNQQNTTSHEPLKTEIKEVNSIVNNLIENKTLENVTNVNKVKNIVLIYEDNSFELLNSK